MKKNSTWVFRGAGLVLAAALGLVLGGIFALASVAIPFGQQSGKTAPNYAAVPVAQPDGESQAGGAPLAGEQPAAPAQSAAGAASGQAPAATARRITVLVMGVDNRPDEPVARTDTIMVLSINPQTGQAGMVSLARDLLVEIPGMNQMAKINTAHLYGEVNKYPGGGPGLLRATVGDFLGYKPDYWVRINFEGFRDIIDQIGGIDIVVPKAISDPLYPDEAYGYDPLYIPAGRIHMNGALALKYARTRHVDSDYGRARRQQQVVMAVKDKLMQPSNLANLLTHLPGLAITMAKSVQTDMPVNKAIDLAKAINEAGTGSIQTAVIDDKLGTNSNDPTWGFVLVPDLPRVRAAVAGAFGDGPVSQPAAQLSDPAVAEEGARVAVLNGTTQIDLATRVATNLSAEGYTVIGVGNADRQNYAQSFLITHGNAAPATCAALAQALSIPVDRIRNEATDTNADVVLVIGADLARTQASLLRAVP